MSNMTLEELKRQNDAAEPEDTVTPQVTEELEEDELAAEETEETEGDAELPDDDAEETEVEAWMQSDSQESHDSVPLTAHTKLRSKLKAKIGDRDDEITALRAELEAFKHNQSAPQQVATKRPTREDFDYDDDKYDAALDAYYMAQMDSKLGSVAQKTQQSEQQNRVMQQTEESVGQHYQRAEKLIKDSGITPDIYQAADRSFREVIESVLPGMGDNVTEALIARIGNGSEKVLFAFGRSTERKNELAKALRDDPTGIQAAILLGRKAAEFEMPGKKKTRAPAPAPRAEGGEGGIITSNSKLAKKYAAAEKSGDLQAAFNARREARKAGIDVSKW